LLQQRMHVAKPAAELMTRVPVRDVVFDILRHDDQSLLALSYQERRRVLTALGLAERGLVVPGNFTDTTGEVVLSAVAQQGLEGVVAKRLTSPYQPGQRSRAW
jgi:bifunctional non-homologous end joining protein LigD